MSKPRLLTDEQCRELGDWYMTLQSMGTVRIKAKELGVSVEACYDAIKRGLGQPTTGMRYKIKHAFDEVPRETNKEVA